MESLVERLRREEPLGMLSGCTDCVRLRNPDGPEAADRIAALEAEVARLTSLIAMDTLLQIDGELYDQPAGE